MSKSPAKELCLRCGTIIRNNRAVCPSCGSEVSHAAAICALCMSSVPASTLVEFQGKVVCPECRQRMAAKGKK